MSREQIQGIVRHVLTTLAGIMVTLGYMDESSATAAVGALAGLVGVGWSVVDKLTG